MFNFSLGKNPTQVVYKQIKSKHCVENNKTDSASKSIWWDSIQYLHKFNTY